MAPKFILFEPDVCECGVNWTVSTGAGGSSKYGIAYGAGLFVATTAGTVVWTSPDGINWTSRTCPSANWGAVTFGNGLFVAVSRETTGSSLPRVMTSPNGITWTQRTAPIPASGNWVDITYGNGLYVAVNSSTTSPNQKIMTSPNGTTWTLRTTSGPLSISYISVSYGAGRFVAVPGGSSATIMVSTDGITWTTSSAPTARGWNQVRWLNDRFVVSVNGFILTSTTGLSWTETAVATGNWSGLVFAGGKYFAFARNNIANNILESINGTTWNAVSDGTSTGLGALAQFSAYGNQLIVRNHAVSSQSFAVSPCTC